MRCQFDIVTVPSSDTARQPAIVLSFDDKKYLFNCGEGTQRQMIAQKIPMRKIKEIFTTHGWDSHGGLAGLLLGLTNAQSELILGIHGPRNLAYFLATLRAGQQRGYRYTKQNLLNIEEYSELLPKAFEDANVTIQPILTLPAEPTEQAPKSLDDDSATTSENQRVTNESLHQRDDQRVLNIAHSVWSGQFRERQSNGEWTSPVITQADAGETEQAIDKAPKRARSRSPSDLSTAQRKRRQDAVVPPTKEVPVEDNTYRPSQEQYKAFLHYMNDDLPIGSRLFPAAVSYFIQGRPLPGKFDPIRAKSLGVVPGPDFGRLQKGYCITTSAGRQVKPEEVMGPDRITPSVIMIDCPNSSYIDNLCQNSFWKSCSKDRQPVIIVHSCGLTVLEDARYQQFMSSFGINVKHLLSRGDYLPDPITCTVAATQLANVRTLSEQIYPVPYSTKDTANTDMKAFHLNTINASAVESQLQFTPFPSLSITRREQLPPGTVSREHAILLDQYAAECVQVKESVEALRKIRDESFSEPGDEVEIITLGTGSAGPSSFRNVSGTLIQVPDGPSILLDCGENTIGQFRRMFGPDTVQALTRVGLIFISHLHADHHLGLIGFIREWMVHNVTNKRLFVICPYKYARSILEYGNIEDIGISNVAFIDSGQLTTKQIGESRARWKQWQELKSAMPGISDIRLVPAIHSDRSYCIRIDHESGWSIAYSGDTRPCPNFVDLGKGVTCLIHEATFENDKLDEAVKKKHSTVGEALQVSRDMRAKTTILTHFSQRYPKFPILTSEDLQELSTRNIGTATDMMRVKIKDIWQLIHHLAPQIKLAAGLAKLNITEAEQEEVVDVDD